LGCYPEELFDQLKTLPGFNARELAMDMAQEANATEGSGEEGQIEWVELHARREEHWGEVVTHLLQKRPTELTAILLDGPDKVQHLCWRFLDPNLANSLSAEEQQVRDRCLNFYARLDAVLARIVSSLSPETTVVLASDHGFGATTEIFHINSWLAQAGYLTWSDASVVRETADGILGMRQLTRHNNWIDWQKTRAYASTPTGNGVHIVIAEDNNGYGVPRHEYDQFREELRQALLSYKAPNDGKPVVTEVWTREEIFPGEVSNYGPDLTLTLRDGGLFSILPAEQVLHPRPQPVGTHRPIGIFAARGPGIKRGLRAGELSILDVAPLLLYSLDVPVPNELEGRVPLEIYEAAYRAKHHVAVAPAQINGKNSPANSALVSGTGEGESAALGSEGAPAEGEEGLSPVYDDDGEATIMARLRSLGYIN
jgi:predicted AlkP superfamily phosphohydrolase/phosphomutase